MLSLGDLLGLIFAQLPPSYSPAFLDDLTSFLEACLDSKASLALEVRHLDWFREPHASQLTALLEQLGVGRVLLDICPIYTNADDPQLQSERRKLKLPLQYKQGSTCGISAGGYEQVRALVAILPADFERD